MNNPLLRASGWIDEARVSEEREPDAMALATTTSEGRPSVRIVLCRGIDSKGIRFFTSYESRKGHELLENPYAAVVFLWASLGRQLRIEGSVSRLPAKDSDAYFHARPRGHQLSGAVSPQSREIGDLEELRVRVAELTKRTNGQEVPRPATWGGYYIEASAVEFWIQGEDRLHDRERWELRGGVWRSARLAP
jgi:pyridoxamine 5'-phosphate oxidase